MDRLVLYNFICKFSIYWYYSGKFILYKRLEKLLKIVYLGDVVGKVGREAVLNNVSKIREKYSPDVFIVNGENAAHGFGITPRMCNAFYDAGVDVIVTGNHAYDQKEIIPFLEESNRIIRPLNFPTNNPGKGFCVFETISGRKVLIVQIQGRLFMEPLNCPIEAIDALLLEYKLKENVDAIFVDIHAEATAEKLSIGQYLDGRVSAVFGTHTHVPTSDYKVMKKGTAYQTDVGMCGDYDSVIGFEPETPIKRLLHSSDSGRLIPASGVGTVFGVCVEISDETGLATDIEQIRIFCEDKLEISNQ